MKQKEFSKIFRKYKKEAMTCLKSKGGWGWEDKKRTVKLLNKILAEVPKDLFPKSEDETKRLRDGNWGLTLMIVDGKQSADLRFIRDDHTAWVIKTRNGRFGDFDIGGS
jgi:hypothetical protein